VVEAVAEIVVRHQEVAVQAAQVVAGTAVECQVEMEFLAQSIPAAVAVLVDLLLLARAMAHPAAPASSS